MGGAHPVRRGLLRDVDEMEKLVDNIFNLELAYTGSHSPVRCLVVIIRMNAMTQLHYHSRQL